MSHEKINLLIDSAQRTDESLDSMDFKVFLSNPLVVQSVTLKSCAIPLFAENIASGLNDFSFQILTYGVNEMTIPAGRYNPYSLINVLNVALTTFDSDAGNVRVSFQPASCTFMLTLIPQVGSPIGGGLTLGGNLLTYMGYIDPNPFGAYNLISNTNPPLINHAPYYKICIDYLDGNFQCIDNNQHFATFFVEDTADYMTEQLGRVINIVNSNHDSGGKFNYYRESVKLQNFRICIRDSNDVQIFAPVNWWCLIELHVLTETAIQSTYASQLATTRSAPHLPLWMRL